MRLQAIGVGCCKHPATGGGRLERNASAQFNTHWVKTGDLSGRGYLRRKKVREWRRKWGWLLAGLK
ncbi:hypothetical protein [Poriferisphaera corsica]|uniref:hypothetical protein n=1 Tax=Poriferisphaera corsica TaxID=2528020 RepID=UPI0011A56340|nr:hypothetical protein [Poriferisphaera corsica]